MSAVSGSPNISWNVRNELVIDALNLVAKVHSNVSLDSFTTLFPFLTVAEGLDLVVSLFLFEIALKSLSGLGIPI